jgi:LmbE family N-acetylglucosaminyl deacetylase
MNVLAIGAHPDDLELLCAGTLARYAQAGHEVFMAIATNGEVGSATLSKEQTAKLRHEEARRSCARIGATLIWMGFPDEWLFDTPEVRARFIDAIREARPEVMLVHSTDDYHPDHRVAGQVAVDARIPSTVRLVETRLPAAERIPHIFVMDTIAGTAFEPELYVDISDVWDTKKAMLEEHRSQSEHLLRSFGIEYTEFMETQARRRGGEAGCRLAEAFREVKAFPVTGSASLLPGGP